MLEAKWERNNISRLQEIGRFWEGHSNTFDIGTSVSSLADKDGVVDCAEQIQLTEIQASEASSRRRGALLAIISVSRICKKLSLTGLGQLVTRHKTFYGVGKTFTCIR